MKATVAALALLAVCGCSAVYAPGPVGLTPCDISGEADEWQGTWAHADGSLTVSVANATNGLLRVGWFEKSRDGLQAKAADVHLRRSGEWRFASLRSEDRQGPANWVWGRIEKKPRAALVWAPRVSRLRELVLAGRLPGTTNRGGDVVLGALATNDYDLICAEGGDVLFEWDQPLVLWRVGE